MTGAAKRALFGVAVVLGFMIGLETHIDHANRVTTYGSYLAVSGELDAAMAQTATLTRKLQHDTAGLQALREASDHAQKGIHYLRFELNRLNRAAGLTPVVGNGIRIVINYDPKLPVIAGLRYVNEATQLQMVVNLLQAGGAKGIAINQERLITTSSIRSVNGLTEAIGPFGGTVQINEVPVAAPYIFAVLGSPTALTGILRVEGIADQFTILDQSFTVTSYTKKRTLQLPAYTGVMPGSYAKEVGV